MVTMVTCDNCGGKLTMDGYEIKPLVQSDQPKLWMVCSMACLTEFAWKLRESQPKLSKSNQT